MRQCLTMLIGIVVLLSTTGVPHVQHLCGGIVQSAGIWIGEAGCNHEDASISSCSSIAQVKQDQHASAVACCKKPAIAQAEKEKDCCTNQVEWEPSQFDLAICDQLVLEGHIPFVIPATNAVALLNPSATEIRPYIRPPPLVPVPQTRRRALLQVYSC